MDRIALGLRIRALRIRAALRQSDLALAAGVPRRTIGELENGTFAHVSVDQLVRVGASLRATVDVRIRWHGEDLDRLIDAAHAATVAAVLERLRAWKWEALVEVSFAIWGERGSIDALAWHAPSRSLLVIEVKSVLPDLQATLRDLDRKTRLGPAIARERGWRPEHVGRLLVLAESATARGRVRRQDGVLRPALPDRGASVRRWLASPDGSLAGLLFLSNARHSPTGQPLWRRQRVHCRKRRRTRRSGALNKEFAIGSG